jgi:adenylate cyclase
MRIPIAVKLISLTLSFLILSTVLFVYVSSLELTTAMVLREEEANKSYAENKATEVDQILTALKEKTEINGALLMKARPTSKDPGSLAISRDQINAEKELEFNFSRDRSLLALEIVERQGQNFQSIILQPKKSWLEEKKLQETVFVRARTEADFPLPFVFQKNLEVMNISPNKETPVFALGLPLVQDAQNQVSHIVIAYYDLRLLQKSFSQDSERTFFLSDRRGILLAHQNEQLALTRKNFKSMPVLKLAFESTLPQKQISFEDKETAESSIGAYVKNLAFGTTVVATIQKRIVLEPAENVKREAIKMAGYMISGALILIFLFSVTLTSPIEKLAGLIQHVARGDFNIKAKHLVKSHDEVGDLAAAFDNMTEGLKERDKVKNLFSKFHGSSVAEDLLKNDIGVGGQNKQVTVFFSDIRGFTSFSEQRTPEEVVQMLNEYFEVMVSIINRNHGVVDKFIGDAIMAVWGVPHSSGRDTQNAVKACLEMRKALLELNQKRESKGQTPLMIGMGLHAGPAISGTIGSSERMEYTVIGDTVNMTSRIESSTKAFGTDLLISEAVYDKVQDEFATEVAGTAEVKGKAEPIKLYKVIGFRHKDGRIEEIKTPYSEYAKEDAEKVKVAG